MSEMDFLADETLVKIGEDLLDQAKELVLINKRFYGLFQPPRLIAYLLKKVANGEQDKIGLIISTRPEVLILKGSVRDNSGRIFKNISPFQLTLWALDVKYMAFFMLACIPENKMGKIIPQLLQQFHEVREKGVTYEFKGLVYKESHYNSFGLLDALFQYSFHIGLPEEKKYLCLLSKQQYLIPAHVAQHYCDKENSFYPSSGKKKFSRTLVYYNWITNQYEHWYLSIQKLSKAKIHFAIIRGEAEEPPTARECCWSPAGANAILNDRNALGAFFLERLQCLNDLEEQLKTIAHRLIEEEVNKFSDSSGNIISVKTELC